MPDCPLLGGPFRRFLAAPAFLLLLELFLLGLGKFQYCTEALVVNDLSLVNLGQIVEDFEF
ncbi:hypothetical protein BIT28_10705 [Photobacterium proteolyticum]|uniref:Uncharacterized protein n=1 Tax=Photobacterium proteolyticum TaxID=1903952 RepID=A0A1Q9G6U0_9GAMM|nr:hypothetical protein [Photobacterium proteolyticum]OLQ70006.1 hypothetical protein BIT28_10705 [Photobacterium proteolyticum]